MKRKISLLFLALAGTLSAGSVPFTLSRNGSWKPDESGKVFTRTVREGQTEWCHVLASAKLAPITVFHGASRRRNRIPEM